MLVPEQQLRQEQEQQRQRQLQLALPLLELRLRHSVEMEAEYHRTCTHPHCVDARPVTVGSLLLHPHTHAAAVDPVDLHCERCVRADATERRQIARELLWHERFPRKQHAAAVSREKYAEIGQKLRRMKAAAKQAKRAAVDGDLDDAETLYQRAVMWAESSQQSLEMLAAGSLVRLECVTHEQLERVIASCSAELARLTLQLLAEVLVLLALLDAVKTEVDSPDGVGA